jgi:hypothetical protein
MMNISMIIFVLPAKHIISSLSGNTSYKYTDGNNQTKSREVWWNTVKIHGVEWKIVSEQE